MKLLSINDILNEAIDYAKNHKIRLLIEIDPANGELYIYCDDFNISDIAEILRKIRNLKKHYISTNFFIKYKFFPSLVELKIKKAKTVMRFWKQTKFNLVELEDKDIYFVDLKNGFKEEEKKILIDCMNKMNFKRTKLVDDYYYINDMLTFKNLENIEFNMYNDFGVIFYK